ncbi:UDP-3-O-(3-hydroxymyristoyl)glucosamine N-acyltransferase [Tateyamaria pelophila]|uniref:UDP-3-O-(3-hydroxymyristoyl)glucosamine N-acyltransferase n=1 Tax=Tateyamaria pelophila TaxID=328415 RepID=UPI001CBCC27A|nr:UDP-3-O-(3-hydroxymyristoyl)glucosamine N-acyltransferase [Tateyamaria pelophila]
MRYTVRELAQAIDADSVGDTGIIITGLSEPADAGCDDLALASTPEYAGTLTSGQAKAAMLWHGADWRALGLQAAILPKRPRFALAGLTRMMDPGQGFGIGIHPTAILDPSAQIGTDVTIGPGSVIGAQVVIGDRCVIGPQCFIGKKTTLGADCYIREQVSIGARVCVGARFVANPGVRIGGDGFSFVTEDRSGAEAARASLGDQGTTQSQSWTRIHSLGSVIIGEDVEIGANSTIDNGTIRPTRIGHRTKIDNLVHIGHNVIIGTDGLICGQVGVAGSVTVGNHVVMAGQVGVSDNLTIGDRVILGAASKVLRSVQAGKVMLGYPATEMRTQIESYKALRRLPRMLRELQQIKKAVFKSGDSD